MNASPNPIEQSFELAASCCADLTPLVYQRLFKEHPETRALDFAGQRSSGHFRLIACEVVSHDAYSTPRDLFIAFFAIIRDTLHSLLGDEWSAEIAQAWGALLVEIEAFAGIAA